MSKSKQYILTSEEDIVKRIRDFTAAHIIYEKTKEWDDVNRATTTRIVTSVTHYSNGDCLRYDVTTINLGDTKVSVEMLTLKHGDNVEVYLAPYDRGDLDVASD